MTHSKEKLNQQKLSLRKAKGQTTRQRLKNNYLTDAERIKENMCRRPSKQNVKQKDNILKEIENLKGNRKDILELKITIIEMKNSLKGFKGRLEQAEESVTLKTRHLKWSSPRKIKEKD